MSRTFDADLRNMSIPPSAKRIRHAHVITMLHVMAMRYAYSNGNVNGNAQYSMLLAMARLHVIALLIRCVMG